eukprot:TRINITY_DN23656_c0_g1_i1.p3 TRINITY_DN23656_c0_g1~~TRINITY_DN23656_c0_g1_i1.p3  ORF type:complete len:245 (+),score=86.47 TRINITY_DN23656_c0_g1_i1:907-1641(+)
MITLLQYLGYEDEYMYQCLKAKNIQCAPLAPRLDMCSFLIDFILSFSVEVRTDIEQSIQENTELRKQKREKERTVKRQIGAEESLLEMDEEEAKSKRNSKLAAVEQQFERKFLKHRVQVKPLGFDRNMNRYYRFPGYPDRIFIQIGVERRSGDAAPSSQLVAMDVKKETRESNGTAMVVEGDREQGEGTRTAEAEGEGAAEAHGGGEEEEGGSGGVGYGAARVDEHECGVLPWGGPRAGSSLDE